MTNTEPTGELAMLLALTHGQPDTRRSVITAPPQTPHPVATRPLLSARALAVIALAAVVLAAVTVWSIGQLHAGVVGTPPPPQPLPATTFAYNPAAPNAATGNGSSAGAGNQAPGAAGASTTTPGAGAVPAVGGQVGTGSNASGTAVANPGGPLVPAGPRPQTPTVPLTADQLVIPAIGVTAAVSDHGLSDATDTSRPCTSTAAFGCALVIPGDVSQVMDWTGSAPITATTGTVLVAGHIDNADQGPGALHDIYTLNPGDLIYLTRHGVNTRWKVVARQWFPKNAAHPDWFAGATGPRLLTLVTCGGPYDAAIHSYDDNVTVTAIPA